MDVNKLRSGLATFGWNLYQSLSATGGNVFVSPHSVCSALMLACLGAKGDTETQIIKAIGLSEGDAGKVHELFKGVNDSLQQQAVDGGETDLAIANRLYVKKAMQIADTYVQQSSSYYDNSTEQMDFGQNPSECRTAINAWVEQQTKEKIKDLLAEGSITGATNLVLVNAIYFKGKWETPFKVERTEKADFHVSATETVQVDMMRADLKVPVHVDEELKCAAVSVPYKSRGISMILVLPDKDNSLAELEVKLSSSKAVSLRDNTARGLKGEVELGLPKFTMTETSDLSTILPKLGIADLFDATKADLSGLSSEPNIAIDDVVHKAFIEVNEEGTEAAAATAMISRMAMIPLQKHTLIFDRPFLFLLSDDDTGALLFVGRYSRPE